MHGRLVDDLQAEILMVVHAGAFARIHYAICKTATTHAHAIQQAPGFQQSENVLTLVYRCCDIRCPRAGSSKPV